ncbi:MAG: TerB family tellurite resistance protein [Acidobacteriota bacterium]
MTPEETNSRSANETAAAETIRTELRILHALDPSSSRLLEALACVLARVAGADREICDSETAEMEGTLMRLADLPPAQAVLAVEIAKQRTCLGGAGYTAAISRDLRRRTDPRYRLDLLHSLVDVACADGDLCDQEVAAILRIAAELGFSRQLADELIEESQRSLRA